MLKSNSIIKAVILFASALSFGTLPAQQPDETAKRAMEREIKASGDYLYGEAVGNTKDEAVKMAKTALISEINKEALNHPEWQFAKSIQAKDVEYKADMIDLMRGNKFRVIAYIKKDGIQLQPETGETNVSEAGQTQTQPATVAAQAGNTGGLLGQILNAPSVREIQKILVENKKKGKAAYGTMDKLTAPDKAYLIVYKKTGEIVAILDRGSEASRKDLLSGETKEKELLDQNQVIWFQLF
jgi:hypothetical protein